MSLLRADLQMLGNLPTTRAGRAALLGAGTGLALIAAMSWWFARTLATQPQLLAQLHVQRGDDALHGLLGYGLLGCPLVATWLGLSLGQRQLFEATELPLWRLAPIPSWRGPLQALLRACFVSSCWAMALTGPFLAAVLPLQGAPWWAYALIPIAVVGATSPLLAGFLAVQIVVQRLCGGRLLRLLLVLLGALASVGFSTWLLTTLFRPEGQQLRQVVTVATSPQSLPWTVDTAAQVLAQAARGVLPQRELLALLGWLAIVGLGFKLVARLHPRAHERMLASEAPWRRSRGAGWPANLAACVRRKELAQVLQQPGALLGFLLSGCLVLVLMSQRSLLHGMLDDPQLPADVTAAAALLVYWFLAVMLVLYAHMGRFALWDGPQWSLYVAAPAAPGAILRGKQTAVLWLLAWPLLLVAGCGAPWLGASLPAVATFVGVALGGTLSALGVLTAVGTWPRLMRPDDGGPVAQGGRGFLAALLLVALFEVVAVAPAVFGWLWLVDHARGRYLARETTLAALPWVVGAAWLLGLLVAGFGSWLGVRNYRRLLGPT